MTHPTDCKAALTVGKRSSFKGYGSEVVDAGEFRPTVPPGETPDGATP